MDQSDLLQISKPAQYLGGERGSVTKEEADVSVRVCLAFPDSYEVGMSHTGYQILYDLLNRIPHIWAERCYMPLPDMEDLLRTKDTPLCSLESKRPLQQFDIVGFSLQYELCMSGILGILSLGRISLLSKDRSEADPIIIGGGPVAYHPEPFADFFDAFLIGDGEELVPEFLERYQSLREQGKKRHEIIEELRHIKGVYVPRLFEAVYDQQGLFNGLKAKNNDYTSVSRRVLATLENAPFPKNPIIPNIKAVHDRLSVEVMRGCVRGCRFCQAGYLYRPQRERAPEEIRSIVKESLKNSGHEELSLLSLSTADYCSILPLLKILKDDFATDDNLAISFPSTRVDALTPELLQEVQPIRRSGFTMAPEAGTQRLRDVINKGVTDQQIIDTSSNVFSLGWTSVKMYFMIGLPTETDEDVFGIIDIAKRVKEIAGKKNQVTVSVSTHVPKPHTPFQWAKQISVEETKRLQKLLADNLKSLGVTFRYHSPESSALEGFFARGDRRLSRVILRAFQNGSRQEGWSEELSYQTWREAFDAESIDPELYLRERSVDEALPWDHISCDIPKRYFEKEWKRAQAVTTTPDCLTATCSTCGSCDYDAVRNVLFDRKKSESRLKIIDPPWNPIIEERGDSLRSNLVKTPLKAAPSECTPEGDGAYQLKEYLKTEVDRKRKTLFRPDRELVSIIRARFSKLGTARMFSHLETVSLFARACRRANLPIVFSKGFSPKPKLSFGPPAPLGVESTHEFVDFALYNELSVEEFVTRLNDELPSGVQILEASIIPSSPRPASLQSLLTALEWRATPLHTLSLPIHICEGWKEKKIFRERKRKKSQVQLTTFVSSPKLDDNSLRFQTLIDKDGKTVKPSEVTHSLVGLASENFVFRKIGANFSKPVM